MELEITLRYEVDNHDEADEVSDEVYEALRSCNLEHGFDQDDVSFVETLWTRDK